MFEHHRQPLLSRPAFFRRVTRFAVAALVLIAVSWLIGILGYRLLENLSWIDAILNSAMLLGGMGPVNELKTDAGKLFAAFYALFAGLIFLVAVGVFLAPVAHRAFHSFHLAADEGDLDDEEDDGLEVSEPSRK
ncbi:MAG: hypothetical protein IPK19_22980 [Chloroflexi bacterium]|nr:hypothetical protein [Chloroflexota bacterium]